MWLLNFLPDWFFHLVLLAGIGGLIASLILKFIPFVSQYRLVIQVASIAMVIGGTFFEGVTYNEAQWQQKVVEAEKRALEAEAKSAQENVKLVTKTVEKIKLVQDVQVVVQKEIVRDTAIIDAECKVPVEFVAIHNKSATAREAKK